MPIILSTIQGRAEGLPFISISPLGSRGQIGRDTMREISPKQTRGLSRALVSHQVALMGSLVSLGVGVLRVSLPEKTTFEAKRERGRD